MQGVVVDEDTLALDQIDEVGFDDDFLALDHTNDHFREDWYPTLLNRKNHQGWVEEGENSLRQRAKERILKILEEHQPEPLPNEIAQGVQKVMDRVVQS
jgi:trimethylamine--corrinoid protein Co-methyltransferase